MSNNEIDLRPDPEGNGTRTRGLDGGGHQKRNRNFSETHQALIEKAVELVSLHGLDALSVSALARETGLNRSTLYYHFDGREALIEAVKAWSSQQLALGFNPKTDRRSRIDHITSFVLKNPEVIKLWIDDFIAPGNIRDRYPHWDELIHGLDRSMRAAYPHENPDAEVFSVILLTAAFIGPRVFKHSVRPDESDERIVERFVRETQRMLSHEAVLATWTEQGGGEQGGTEQGGDLPA